jgi:cytoskeletal protein CcmA (bactofilin family)
MEKVRLARRSTATLGRVDGDLEVEDHALLQASDRSGVVVVGKAIFEGSVEVDCSLECGSLESSSGIVRISGDLTAHGKIEADDAIYIRGNTTADKIEVGGKLSVGNSLVSNLVDVGGSLEVQGNLESASVDVGGSVDVQGELKVKQLDVGGKAEIGGGRIEEADVGGTLVSRKPLGFGRLDVGGTIEIEGGEGDSIEVGGRLLSFKPLKCRQLKVGGTIEVDGGMSGTRVEVGGKLDVSGDLELTEDLEVGGMAVVGGTIIASRLVVGVSLRADKCIVNGSAEVGHRIETSKGMKAASLTLGSGGICRGPIVATKIDLGVAARVEDVYCSSLTADRASKLGKVWADEIHLDDDCFADSIAYTREMKEGARLRYNSPPQKVDSLPASPI